MTFRLSAKLFIVLCFLAFFTGCHFVGDGDAMGGTSGFFAGFWDGMVLVYSVVLTCFTDIRIVDLNNSGFLYKVGYAIGVLGFSWNLGILAGMISLILYILPL